jgi:Family of unknown function (DUF6152)
MKRHLATAAMLALALPALAHHGWSEYDQNQSLTLTGKVAASGYEHPHGHIRLETPGKAWQVILAPPSRMQARGLPREDIKVGSTVTVVAYPNRGKPDEARAERITANGKTVELR